METPVSVRQPLRLAILSDSISHFEAPLFRLLANSPDVEIRVFYRAPVNHDSFDAAYGQSISWGGSLLAGYESEQVNNVPAMDDAARAWGADVLLLYGYGWKGAPELIIRNWLAGRPQIHRGTLNYHLDPRRPIRGRLMRPIGRLLLSLFDAHHYGGDYSRKVLLDAGAKPESLHFVPYSVDTPYFLERANSKECVDAAGELRHRLGWSMQDRVILFIAQHNWFKGPDIAMATFARVAAGDPTARFLIVGSGGMTDEMKSAAERDLIAGSFHFAGFIPSADTIPYYLAADLVLCSSRYETWARMVNEAMLCGRSCLVSKIVPAAGGLIEHGVNGIVVDVPKAESFAAAIQLHFERAAEERARMGEAARERAQYFSYETHVGNAVDAVHHAAALHPHRRGAHR